MTTLSCDIKISAVCSVVSSQSTRVTDRRTDRQNYDSQSFFITLFTNLCSALCHPSTHPSYPILGSVTTYFTCQEKHTSLFNMFVVNLISCPLPTVRQFWKLITILHRYCQNSTPSFFLRQNVYCCTLVIYCRKDEFTVKCLSNVGTVKWVKIEHDNSGSNAGWFLNAIQIRELNTHNVFVCPCFRWLARDEDDRQISRVLNCARMKGSIQCTYHYDLISSSTSDIRR